VSHGPLINAPALTFTAAFNACAAIYTQTQLLRGVIRASEAAKLYRQQAPAPAPEPVVEEEVDTGPEVDYGPVDKLSVNEVVVRLQEAVGPREFWIIRGIREEDIDLCMRCCERIAALCSTNKKHRASAVAANAFEALANCMTKYQEDPNSIKLFHKCWEATEAICKKAESENLQDDAAKCFFSLVKTLQVTMIPALRTIHNMTINHRENSIKLIRAGGRCDWFSEHSNIVPPDQQKGAWPFDDGGKKK